MSGAEARARLFGVWRRVFDLSWPVMAEHVLRTLMRTTDILVMGLFSPAAVAAIGLADLYARLPLRIGLGLGSGVIALSSQDTGSGAIANRDEAITQALGVRLGFGVPAIYASIAVYYLWSTAYVAIGFYRGGWVARTEAMMAERGSAATED